MRCKESADRQRASKPVTTDDSPPVRRSIEVEYWVIDDEGRLTDADGLAAAAPGVEREFVEPLIEIKTTPCVSTAELRAELFERLRAVLQQAAALDKRLVPLATPLNHDEIRELPSERTRIQNDVIGEAFQYVRHCAGTHIHFEQQPGHTVDQLNTLIALDPALALLNSTPYFRGEAIAAGARSKLYRWRAYDGLDHQGRLWPYPTDTVEWNRRLEARYAEFRQQALDAGVDRAAVESCFDPESAVWTPVQLRAEFNTVEWRSPDATLPARIIRLADTMAEIIDRLRDCEVKIGGDTPRIVDDEIVLPEFETVRNHVAAAIEDGLSATALRSYLTRMGFDVDAYEPVTHDLAGRAPVTPTEARQLRLQYADRLRAEVTQTPAAEAD